MSLLGCGHKDAAFPCSGITHLEDSCPVRSGPGDSPRGLSPYPPSEAIRWTTTPPSHTRIAGPEEV